MAFRNYQKDKMHNLEPYKEGLLVKDGYMTVRQGRKNVELGYPLMAPENQRQWRSVEGAQYGPTYLNPQAPIHQFQRPPVRELSSFANCRQPLQPHELETRMREDPSYKGTGLYYPYGRNLDQFGKPFPEVYNAEKPKDPKDFYVQSDELRKWLLQTRG